MMPNSKSCHPLIISPALLLFFAMLASPAPAQEKTTFHYPLNDGNVWEYEAGPSFPCCPVIERWEVMGDTLLATGKTYKILEITNPRNGNGIIFQRIENNNLYQFVRRFIPPDSVVTEEVLLYKLKVAVGDTWQFPFRVVSFDSCYYEVFDIDSTDFFNRKWKKVDYWVNSLSPTSLCGGGTSLLDSLGISSRGSENATLTLLGAFINGQRYGTLTSVDEPQESGPTIPTSITLFAARPNPAINSAKLHFTLNRPDVIRITIFDILGRQVYAFPQQPFGAGSHVVRWEGAHQFSHAAAATGLYFAVITDGLGSRLTRKFLLVR